jgi:hypothetical protein
MINIRDIEIKKNNDYLITAGLKRIIGFEITLLIRKLEVKRYLKVMSYLIDYFIDYKPVINNEQTIAYHSWLLKFVQLNDTFNLFEVDPNDESFIEGVDIAINIVALQEKECISNEVTPIFPTFSQMIVISKGVLEGKTVEGVRYPSPNHMTGWWLTTELYDNDVKSLQVIHYYHLVFKRSDIIKYLALPFGFRFSSGEANEVRFDENVLQE